ncbi:MAG: IPExxxVDY family protein [Bacteroidota bacterium]|nr:IPExxxVDY family protein [Bacteroidota bacterium]
MSEKLIINDNSFPKRIIALSLNESSFRASWIIGKNLGLEFKKEPNIELKQKGQKLSLDNYTCIQQNDLIFRLIANKSELNYLVQKHKNFDYFLMFSNTSTGPKLSEVRAKLQEAKGILGAFIMNPPKEVSKVLKNYTF